MVQDKPSLKLIYAFAALFAVAAFSLAYAIFVDKVTGVIGVCISALLIGSVERAICRHYYPHLFEEKENGETSVS